jgi:SAM-dependent methyltransferase
MTHHTSTPDHPGAAYDRLAPHYDEFTAGYAYERWISAIEDHAAALGLRGRRALDLGCGTGSSTAPLLARGYSVVACDISPGMIREARRKYPRYADSFEVADMRHLPELGEFDLVLCLDDAVNYLLRQQDLEATFRCVARALSPTGIFAFDLNSVYTYRTAFAQAMVKEGDDVFMAWKGETSPQFRPGGIGAATVEIFSRRGDGLWERSAMRHVQRHHPPHAVRAALWSAGLRCETFGQHPGAQLEDDFDEERHIKVVYFARHVGAARRLTGEPRTGHLSS